MRHQAWPLRDPLHIGSLSMLLAALGLLSAWSLGVRWQELRDARAAHAWVQGAMLVSHSVHELQRERGLSIAYLSARTPALEGLLRDQRALSNQALEQLRLRAGAEQIPGQIDAQALDLLRQEVSAAGLSVDAVMRGYAEIAQPLNQIAVSHSEQTGELNGLRIALLAYMQAKELSGQLRARVARYLAVSSADQTELRPTVLQLDREQREQLKVFEALALPHWRAAAQQIQQDAGLRGQDAMLAQVLGSAATPAALPAPRTWFDLASLRIDAMKRLEDRMAGEFAAEAARRNETRLAALGRDLLVAVLMPLLALAVYLGLWRSRRQVGQERDLAQNLIESSLESIVLTDGAGRIVWVNAAFSSINGWSSAEVLGRHVRLLHAPRHEARFYHGIWQAVSAEGKWSGEIWSRRKDGEQFPAHLSIVRLDVQADGKPLYSGMTLDLSKHKDAEAAVRQLRSFDTLTGMLSRASWMGAVADAIARDGKQPMTVIELGLDRFKMINESLSFAVGDRVLSTVAERLRTRLRRGDVCARVGGDRFSIMLHDCGARKDVLNVCQKFLEAVAEPMLVDGTDMRISASIGTACFPADGDSAELLYSRAEAAMYRAKSGGNGRICFYTEQIGIEIEQSVRLETLLSQALAQQEFHLMYQPQVDAHSGALRGVEALLRWKSPVLGNVPPAHFIPLAEELNQILPIGEWVLKQATRDCRHWLDAHGLTIPVAVNLSPRQFADRHLLRKIQAALDESALPGHLLELEITEGALVGNATEAALVLRKLRDTLQVRIALDDFGTGYSSLSYLKSFPLDRLKIDRAFVCDLPSGANDVAICRTIISLAQNLALEVLAEGVETQEQSDFLRENGCDLIQGYLYSRPLSAETLLEQVEAGRFADAA